MQLKVVRFASRCACGFAAAAIVLALSSFAAAQTTYYWTTAPSGPVQAGNGAWDVSGAPNWATDPNGDGVGSWQPGNNADFYASGASTVAVNGNQSVNNITFDGSGYTISGGSLTLGSGVITANANATINSCIVSAPNGLTKAGAGYLTLGYTPYTGPTTINAGTLAFSWWEGAFNSAVTVNQNGTLYAGATTYGTPIGGLSGNGTVVVGAAGGYFGDDNTLYINGNNAVTTFSGNIITNSSGSDGGIEYAGGQYGQLTLTGNNTYNGLSSGYALATAVWSGTLVATTRNSLPVAGGVDFEGGVLMLNTAGPGANSQNGFTASDFSALMNNPNTYPDGGSLALDTSYGNFVFSTDSTNPNLWGSFPLIKVGSNALVVTGGNSGWYSPATVNNGTLQLGSLNALQGAPVIVNVAGGLTFSPGIGSFNIGSLYGPGSFALADTNGGGVNLVIASGGSYTGNLSGAGSLTLSGGQLILAGVNTYLGSTTIGNSTTIVARRPNSLPGAPTYPNVSIGNAVTFGVGVGGANDWQKSDLDTFLGGSVLPSSATLGMDATDGNFTYTSNISTLGGATNFSKIGGGNLTLSGNITFPGSLYVAGGTLTLTGTNSYGGVVPGPNGFPGWDPFTGVTQINGGVLSVSSVRWNLPDPELTPDQMQQNPSWQNNGWYEHTLLFLGGTSGGTLLYTGTGAGDETRAAVTVGTYVNGVSYPATIDVANSNGGFAFNTYVGSGGGDLIKTGPGTLILGGINDNGGLSPDVEQGTLILAKWTNAGHAVSSVNSVWPGATLLFGAPTGGAPNGYNIGGVCNIYANVNNMNGTFDLGGWNEGIFGLTGTGVVTNSVAGSTSILTFGYVLNGWQPNNYTWSNTFGGNFVDGQGPVGIAITSGTCNYWNGGAVIPFGAILVLTGTGNAYSGGTTIGGGTLEIGNGATSPGSLSGNVVISDTTVGGFTIPGALALAPPSGTTLTVSGNISGNGGGGLTKSGPGLAILSGYDTYSGPTTVTGGTLQIGNGGSGEYIDNTPSITLSNGATVAFNHNDSLSYGGTISGSGQLIKLGTGALDLSGVSTYSGPTTISAGTLELDVNGNNLPTTTALSIASSGVLDMDGVPQTVGSLSGSAGAIIMNHWSPLYPSTLTVSPSSGSTTFAGNITSNVALAVSGNGELTLSGTNSYSGGTTVSGGTLDIAAPSALAGSGLVTIAAGGRLVLGSGAGIGALLAASSPAGSEAVALSGAASASATLGGSENTAENMATLGGAPPLSQGGGGSAVGASAAAVPEPGTFALLGVGALGLIGWAWRRRKAT